MVEAELVSPLVALAVVNGDQLCTNPIGKHKTTSCSGGSTVVPI